ncbi:MAG: hypothetical protein R3Y26_05560 [Rikenellaceae bacterium]
MKKKIYLVIILGGFSLSSVFAQRFDCRYIESLYNSVPTHLLGGDNCYINGFRVKVDSLNSVITNVGVRIPNIGDLSDALLESFAERKLLEVMLAKSRHDLINVLDYSKAKLLFNGDDYVRGAFWNLKEGLKVVKENESMQIYRDSLSYSIQWGKGNDKVALNFPANIQIITSKDKAELECGLADLLMSDYNFEQDVTTVDISSLEKKEGDVYAKKGSKFIIDGITNSTYLQKDKQSNYELIYSPGHIAKTFSNLFYFPKLGNNSIEIEIQHRRYANEISKYILTLPQLVAFCNANALTPYIGIESEKEELLEATVILHSKKYNYIHLLYVKTNTETLMRSSGAVMYCQMYSYINTDNVADLFM